MPSTSTIGGIGPLSMCIRTRGSGGSGSFRAGKNYGGRVRAVRELEAMLVGRDARRIEQVVWKFTQGDAGRDRISAVSAVEQALWDILGKALGVPVHTLLGGACREAIRLYANINRATTDRTPEGFAQHAAAAAAEGFDAVKLAPFDGMPAKMDSAKEAREGIACMYAVRGGDRAGRGPVDRLPQPLHGQGCSGGGRRASRPGPVLV